MRTSLVSVLAALVSIASTLPTGYSAAHQGRIDARDPANANLQRNVPRSQPSGHPARAVEVTVPPDHARRAAAVPSHKSDRRRDSNAPRAAADTKPSPKPDRRRDSNAPRAAADTKPSPKPDRRRRSSDEPAYYAPRAAAETKPSPKPDRRRAEPAAKPSRRALQPQQQHDGHAAERPARQAQQNAFGGNGFLEGLVLGWLDEDQCPAPLSACPVRGARDPDAFECVDLESDLYSCGGCAADDISYDCNAISHARSVECVFGFCEVRTCAEGYVVAPMRDVCVRVGPR